MDMSVSEDEKIVITCSHCGQINSIRNLQEQQIIICSNCARYLGKRENNELVLPKKIVKIIPQASLDKVFPTRVEKIGNLMADVSPVDTPIDNPPVSGSMFTSDAEELKKRMIESNSPDKALILVEDQQDVPDEVKPMLEKEMKSGKIICAGTPIIKTGGKKDGRKRQSKARRKNGQSQGTEL